MPDHSINWYESAHRHLVARFAQVPAVQDRAAQVTSRLTSLLFTRLPAGVSRELFELLPEHQQRKQAILLRGWTAMGDASIGYPEFVERARLALGNPLLDSLEDELYREIADAFLWAVAREIPADLKGTMSRYLPAELKSRMDLYSAVDESKVA